MNLRSECLQSIARRGLGRFAEDAHSEAVRALDRHYQTHKPLDTREDVQYWMKGTSWNRAQKYWDKEKRSLQRDTDWCDASPSSCDIHGKMEAREALLLVAKFESTLTQVEQQTLFRALQVSEQAVSEAERQALHRLRERLATFLSSGGQATKGKANKRS